MKHVTRNRYQDHGKNIYMYTKCTYIYKYTSARKHIHQHIHLHLHLHPHLHLNLGVTFLVISHEKRSLEHVRSMMCTVRSL